MPPRNGIVTFDRLIRRGWTRAIR